MAGISRKGPLPSAYLVPISERIKGKYTQNGPDECWPWIGYINKNGYGQIDLRYADNRRYTTTAHRAVFMVFVGSIPDGMELDHSCHTKECKFILRECPHRRCVNPSHMEITTAAENNNRRNRFSGTETHCQNGHEFTEKNTAIQNGWRLCRQCVNDRKWKKKNPGKELSERKIYKRKT